MLPAVVVAAFLLVLLFVVWRLWSALSGDELPESGGSDGRQMLGRYTDPPSVGKNDSPESVARGSGDAATDLEDARKESIECEVCGALNPSGAAACGKCRRSLP